MIRDLKINLILYKLSDHNYIKFLNLIVKLHGIRNLSPYGWVIFIVGRCGMGA